MTHRHVAKNLVMVPVLLVGGLLCCRAYADGIYAAIKKQQANGVTRTERTSVEGSSVVRATAASVYAEVKIVGQHNVVFVWSRNGAVFKTHRRPSVTGTVVSNLLAFSPPPGRHDVTIEVDGAQRYTGSVTIQ